MEPYFTPWIGRNYAKTRTLVMSESTYDWTDEDGRNHTAAISIPWHLERFGHNRYFTALNRSLCKYGTTWHTRSSFKNQLDMLPQPGVLPQG